MTCRTIALALGLVLWTPAAGADIPQTYLALLQEADNRDLPGDRFVETADMVAVLVEGGRAEVHAAILAHLPARAGLVADWPLPDAAPDPAPDPAPAPAAAPADAPAAAPAAPAETPRSLGGSFAALSDAPADAGGWLAGPLHMMAPDSWTGHVRAGVQLARGNSDLTDFTFGLELDREFQHGWQIDSQVEYALSETDFGTTRDNWLAELRLARELDSGVGYYLGAAYDRDLVGVYDQSGFLTGGGIWHALAGPKADLVLRAGAGVRIRDVAATGQRLEDAVAEAGASFGYQISPTARFASETTGYAGGGSRLSQRFTLTNRLFANWAVQTGLDIEHEFETIGGYEPTDARLNVSLLYGF